MKGDSSVLKLLIGPVVDLVSTTLNNRAAVKQAEHTRKLQVIQNEASWDATQAANAHNSMKDEWFVFLLSIPLIGAFIPEARPYIEDGFLCLDEMPEYYKGFLAAAIAASFGIKGLAKFKK